MIARSALRNGVAATTTLSVQRLVGTATVSMVRTGHRGYSASKNKSKLSDLKKLEEILKSRPAIQSKEQQQRQQNDPLAFGTDSMKPLAQQQQQQPQQPSQEQTETAKQDSTESSTSGEIAGSSATTRSYTPVQLGPSNIVGQTERPIIDTRSAWQRFSDWRANFLTEERNLATRKYLAKEINQSYVREMIALSKFGDKLFNASPSLIPKSKALYIPTLPLRSILNPRNGESKHVHLADLMNRGKVSVVTFEFSRFGELQLAPLLESIRTRFNTNNNSDNDNSNGNIADGDADDSIQMIRINPQENWLKAGIVWTCLPSLRMEEAKRPLNAARLYVNLGQNIFDVREKLRITNRTTGYLYLVDKNGKIRWYMNGRPTDHEHAHLMAFIQHLQKE